MSVFDEVCCLLDHATRESVTWIGLLEKLCRNQIFRERNLDSYKRFYFGGGSPSKKFLQRLLSEQPDTKIQDFTEQANSHNRGDIVSALTKMMQDYPSLQLMKDLCNSNLEKIHSLLDICNAGIHGWRYFANDYGYKNDDLKKFEAAQCELNQWSPTKQLLLDLKAKEPKFPLEKLKEYLSEMNRKDVEIVINDFIVKMKKVVDAQPTDSQDEISNCGSEPPPDSDSDGEHHFKPIQDERGELTNFAEHVLHEQKAIMQQEEEVEEVDGVPKKQEEQHEQQYKQEQEHEEQEENDGVQKEQEQRCERQYKQEQDEQEQEHEEQGEIDGVQKKQEQDEKEQDEQEQDEQEQREIDGVQKEQEQRCERQYKQEEKQEEQEQADGAPNEQEQQQEKEQEEEEEQQNIFTYSVSFVKKNGLNDESEFSLTILCFLFLYWLHCKGYILY